LKQEAPRQRHSRTGIPAIHGGEHVNANGKYRDEDVAEDDDATTTRPERANTADTGSEPC
jgi:hypothetical protein